VLILGILTNICQDRKVDLYPPSTLTKKKKKERKRYKIRSLGHPSLKASPSLLLDDQLRPQNVLPKSIPEIFDQRKPRKVPTETKTLHTVVSPLSH
jgi:hypothetical protein